MKEYGNDRVIFNKVNVCDEESVRSACENTMKTFGKINILINCAGIGASEELIGHSVETFQKIMQINLFGVFLVTKHVAKYIKEADQDENGVNLLLHFRKNKAKIIWR